MPKIGFFRAAAAGGHVLLFWPFFAAAADVPLA
jgi:hypothetical protein